MLSLNQNFIETGMTNAIWRNRTRAERGNSLYAWVTSFMNRLVTNYQSFIFSIQNGLRLALFKSPVLAVRKFYVIDKKIQLIGQQALLKQTYLSTELRYEVPSYPPTT